MERRALLGDVYVFVTTKKPMSYHGALCHDYRGIPSA